MAAINRFEDLECWKKSRILCQQVYESSKLTQGLITYLSNSERKGYKQKT